MQDVKQAEAEKTPGGEGPLDEIFFWRERNTVLGGLHEQITLPRVNRMIEYVAHWTGDNNLLSTFRAQALELAKLSVEARDNVKFLTTLERHFKAITYGPLSGAPFRTLPCRRIHFVVCKGFARQMVKELSSKHR